MALVMPDPDERTKLALTSANDSIKQALTLSTAILTFTITFSKDIAKSATDSDLPWLRASWVLLGVAILAGVWALLSLTGMIGKKDKALDIYKWSVRIPAGVQMLAFAAALACTALFGLFAFSGDSPPSASVGKCAIEAPATGSCEVP